MVRECPVIPAAADVPMTELRPAGSAVELKSAEILENGGNNFNPFQERQNKSVSDLGAMAHILKGSLGTGILAMPNAFRNAGVIFGAACCLIIGVTCTHCIYILVSTSRYLCWKTRRAQLSFSETAEEAFKTGRLSIHQWAGAARIFVNSALCSTYYSTGVVYTVFIATSLKQLGDIYLEDTLDIRLYIIMLWIPLSLMACIRRLKYLVPFSAISNVLIIVSFGITLYYIFTDLPSPDERRPIASPSQLPVFFSTVIFAMEGIGVVMPIENSMKVPEHFIGCPGVINISMGIVVALYATIGLCGYVKYGEETAASITENLPKTDLLAQMVHLLLAIAIFCTFGLQMHVPNEITWNGIKHRIPEKRHLIAEYAIRLVAVFLIVATAVAVPNLEPIISLVGAVCFSTLGLLCPAVIDSVARWGDESGLGCIRHVKNAIIGVFSLLALTTGAYTSVLHIIAAYR